MPFNSCGSIILRLKLFKIQFKIFNVYSASFDSTEQDRQNSVINYGIEIESSVREIKKGNNVIREIYTYPYKEGLLLFFPRGKREETNQISMVISDFNKSFLRLLSHSLFFILILSQLYKNFILNDFCLIKNHNLFKFSYKGLCI